MMSGFDIDTVQLKKSRHLDFMKQIVKSLALDNYCVDDYVSAVNKLSNPN